MDGCGISCWHPQWIQKFAKTSWFIVVYSLLGTIQSAGTTYFNITLTTIEKRFKIPSQTTGFIISGNEISQILLSLILTYFGGQKNTPKWMSWGIALSALSCFILASPHFIYGAGEEALQYTQEYSSWNQNISSEIGLNSKNLKNKICQKSAIFGDECDEIFSYVPLFLIFLSQFVLGIGNTLYYSLGTTYIDDNTNQRNSPLMLSYASAMRIFGPAFGYGFSYIILKRFYIALTLTPLISRDDQRWMGAWWVGWLLIGVLMFIFSGVIGLFPKSLKKEKTVEKHEMDEEKCESEQKTEEIENGKLKDFPKAIWRLLTNKLLMLNCFAITFYTISFSGPMTFMGRIMEVQFNKTSAGGSAFTGPINMFGLAAGILLSGYIIKKYQPSPKYLFLWNFVIGLVTVFCILSYTQLGCDNSQSLTVEQSMVSCNANCVCEGISYTPLCDHSTSTTYFSPCHAGCKTFDERLNAYNNCSCTEGPSNVVQVEHHVSSGACIGDCNFDFYAYTLISLLSGFFLITGFMSTILVGLRSVEPRDKALGQGFSLFITSLFALIPAPIIFGRIIDSTCLIWNHKCGRQGNCLLYDSIKFRYYIHTASAIFLAIGACFQFMIWYYGRDIDLYGDSNNDKQKCVKVEDDPSEIEPLNTNY
ncbi:solute carrier organic anion transporter family member 74D-like [Contarinia nasturtii]|uniref:solute carrier organic anion transporter family member 74D-like n=2 Tax=Contarinia nasturtii TaxID=265458 RepID=UPI0012D3AF77|nr:solute carrier organic anion transporter family member 74D-like [Contarinia nasturtii]XP_031636085.1 solute carrier organic anion transporter family member 74D-like [Contarinia nasturtii]